LLLFEARSDPAHLLFIINTLNLLIYFSSKPSQAQIVSGGNVSHPHISGQFPTAGGLVWLVWFDLF
jgi:hypothetical protein